MLQKMSNADIPSPHSAQPLLSSRRLELLSLALILSLSLGLRLWGLGDKSLWLDEAASVTISRLPLRKMFQGIAAHDAHPPLHFVVLKLISSARLSEWLVRLPSAAASVAAVWIVYLISRTILGAKAALVSALLMAASGYHVYFAQEARLHSLVTFLILLSWYSYIVNCLSQKKNSWFYWLLYVVATTASLYTYYYAAFSIVGQGIATVIFAVKDRNGKYWKAWAISAAVSVLLFLPWMPVLWQKMRWAATSPSALSQGWVFGGWTLLETLQEFMTGHQLLAREQHLVALYFICVVIFVSALLLLSKKQNQLIICACALLVPYICVGLLQLTPHIFESKHLIYTSPFLFILVGSLWSTSRSKLLPVVTSIVLLCTNTVALWEYYAPSFEKENWRGIGTFIETHSKPGDALCRNPGFLHFPLNLYLESAMPRVPASLADKVDYSTLERSIKRVWLVQSFSRISMPNPAIGKWFEKNWKRDSIIKSSGFLGTIYVGLYERPPRLDQGNNEIERNNNDK